MRALVCEQFGPPEQLVLTEMDAPEPGPRQIAIDVAAAGLNFPDVLVVAGQYQIKTQPPFVPGSEVAGVVAAVGDDVKHFKVGAERRTRGKTGVLIYLSMREHRAEIVADDSIAEKVSAEVWGEAMADMLDEIKNGKIAEGMAVGVRDVGFVLAEHFPRDEDDENELPDRLIEV